MLAASLDRYDHALLAALVEDSTRTNAELSELVTLSPSQCSRRRARLEADGVITGYGARLNEGAMGYALRAITRVTLGTHNAEIDKSFGKFLNSHEEVQSAYSVTGDADYVLIIVTRDLEAFANFIHRELLPHPTVAEVRSEIVLLTLKRG